jgi:hypothetical protein
MIAQVSKMADIMPNCYDFIPGISREFSPFHHIHTGQYPLGTGMFPIRYDVK